MLTNKKNHHMMHTILGSGGDIGTPLAEALLRYQHPIRLVSRHPKRVNADDELFPADLTDPGQVDRAIAGSQIVYVVVGFEYKLSVWQQTWPPFMDAVIQSCIRHQAKLVFFDNVYMYAPEAIPHMTEHSPLGPVSKKGMVRELIHHKIFAAVESGKLEALIARSADFYGPGCKNSALSIMVVDNLLKGKKAQAFGDIDKIHTYTYTKDAAQATALLGNTPDAFNQVWHVPTTNQQLTNRQWIEMIAGELNASAKVQNVPRWMMHVIGVFVPIMREFPEMLYQYEQDYVFDSSKFTDRFGVVATPPAEGIKDLIEHVKQHK